MLYGNDFLLMSCVLHMYLIYIFYPIGIEEAKTKRNAEMKESGSKIFNLVEECRQFFRADEDSDIWRAYLDYIDELVIDGKVQIF